MQNNATETKGSDTKRGLKSVYSHLKPYKNKILLITILGIISALANGAIPYITGKFFDSLFKISDEKTIAQWTIPLWSFFLTIWIIAQFVANNIDWIIDRLKRRVALHVQLKIQADGFIHLFKVPLDYHKDKHAGGQLQIVNQTSWRVREIFDNFVNIAPQLLSVFIGLILAAKINIVLAFILVIGVLVYISLLIFILRPVSEIDTIGYKTWNDGWSDASASVHQVESVKQSASEEYEINKVKKSFYEDTFKIWNKLENLWGNITFFQRGIVFLTQVAIFVISVRYVNSGIISVGDLIALNGYSMMFFGPFVTMGYSWQNIRNGIIAAADSDKIFSVKEEVYKPEKTIHSNEITGHVTFDQVYFKYNQSQKDVLTNINFEVKPGEVVALVGESGVGKSTAISLISGYYFPYKGIVKIDGIKTSDFNLTELRKQIAVVPQEVALFNDTVAKNIKYGSFDSTDEEVMEAARKARADGFIDSFPEKYQSLVGERGIKLSVGQKQRIAIARAILRDPAILILDEPTSALDSQTEKLVTEALEKLMKERTTFIIAHRLSTVRRADKILVFENGMIVEMGSHDELLKKENGIYKKLYELQIGLH